MLQLKTIREEKQRIVAGLRKRNWTSQQVQVIDQILAADEKRRSLQKERDDMQAETNRLSKVIGQSWDREKGGSRNAKNACGRHEGANPGRRRTV